VTAEVDAVISRFYAAFDNREGRVPTEEAMVGLFVPAAVIAKQTPAGFETTGALQFAAPRVALLRSGELTGFHEWETESGTQVAGDLALRTSRYEKAGVFNGQPYAGRGTKFFQLLRTAQGWRILSLAWADD
jgi:hypothetical protein